MNKKQILKFLPIILLVGLVSAVAYYAFFSVTFNVTNPIQVTGAEAYDGESFSITDAPYTFIGDTLIVVENNDDEERTVEIITTGINENVGVGYYELGDYSFQTTIGGQAVDISVEDTSEQVTWTIDFPIDDDTCNGLMAVGLIIATDGEGEGPVFQIHNNDGQDPDYNCGTWLISPWDTTIDGHWNGWHSKTINTPIDTLDWVEATGGRYKDGKEGQTNPWYDDPTPNPNGIFTITIDKSEFGEDFHWALYTAIGSGFCSHAYQQATYPSTFGWGEPIVTSINYEYAELMTELISPLTIPAGSSVGFIPVYDFDQYADGTYVITTEVK